MTRRVTLADVSKQAGVGVATVSRALAAEPHRDVSPATRERIRKIADELGYRPSLAARALRTGEYRALSVIVPDFEWGWWEPVVRSAYNAAEENGYHLLVHPVGERRDGAAGTISALGNVPTDGVIVLGFGASLEVQNAAAALRLPVVSVDDTSANPILPTVSGDNRAGGRMATEHLLSQGRQRLAYVGDTWSGNFVDQRIQGFRDAHDAAGIEVDERLILRCENRWDDPPFTFKELDELLAKGLRFDGMFCEYDRMAGPALRSIRKAGLMVPGDVAVVGYDDEESAKLMDPPLTTIRQPYEELGALAVSLAIQAQTRPLAAVRRTIVPTLRRRQSA